MNTLKNIQIFKMSRVKLILLEFHEFIFLMLIGCCWIVCSFSLLQPFCLGGIISYFTLGSQMTKFHAYLYCFGLVILSITYTFLDHCYFMGVEHIGMQIRVAVCSLVFRKVCLHCLFLLSSVFFLSYSTHCRGS